VRVDNPPLLQEGAVAFTRKERGDRRQIKFRKKKNNEKQKKVESHKKGGKEEKAPEGLDFSPVTRGDDGG